MSASAIANQIQYQDAFANKKQQYSKSLEGGSTSKSAEPKSDFNIGKTSLEDPFKFDDSGYLSNACYDSNSKGKDKTNTGQDAVDDESIYSTPIGKSKIPSATASGSADTPIPYSNNPTADNDNVVKKDCDSSSKQVDDYDKIVKVIHDHITRELPALPPREQQQQQESKPQSVEGQRETKTCCCGHKAAEKSASTDEKESAVSGVEESVAEEKAVAVEPEDQSEGKEEKDEGDDTVIVTPKVVESGAEPVQTEAKVEEEAEKDTKPVENAKDEVTEQKKDEVKPDVVEK
ncbi:hypothetical protein CB0940_08682 [Cercospora beticola]|uniref:Uncharacterized protein n=1 Tax=Cercospora beticola TaxID=122368 RepID=A0A2G5HQR0_CERBT|nr:hypothetical protein CB0940_08682 [Cercospora beticola]PIA94572.1 hypothetical protein CB0940_08682 [Cercospora beticola]WPB05264.1 hypothetical protein RHO25_009916 [Cercospora beticola]CAK1365058.1 unnamed protein product [Cercospora beticola]